MVRSRTTVFDSSTTIWSTGRVALHVSGVLSLLILYVIAYTILSCRVWTKMNRMTAATTQSREPNENDVTNNQCRKKRDAFGTARLPPYERRGIVIPKWSDDTRECDDFDKPPECLIADGYVACFECIESRASLRVCAYVSEPLTIYDEVKNREFILRPNSSPLMGYCVRKNLAEHLHALADANSDSNVTAARRACSVRNADWLLVRRRATSNAKDSSFNFVCRCKYPHLMANLAGPMTACSRDIGCNGHGRLDEDSRASRIDPFVNGRCDCDTGWVSEYDPRLIGPYCREATVGEWPSFLLTDNTNDTIDLYSKYVDAAFRTVLTRNRLDGDRSVRLQDPCAPCPLVQTDDGRAYFCGDHFDVTLDEAQRPNIQQVFIGVRSDRDYLYGNGGQYPNACLTLERNHGLLHDRILVQFMSHKESGEKFAMEIGALVLRETLDKLSRDATFRDSAQYDRFVNKLTSPDDVSLATDIVRDYGVVWTFSNSNILNHRREVCRTQLGAFLSPSHYTDLAFTGSTLRTEYPVYQDRIVINTYSLLMTNAPSKLVEQFRFQNTYLCPDTRGLDNYFLAGEYSREIDEVTAHQIARSLLPICMVEYTDETTGAKHQRPEINCNHPNNTGCVMFRNDNLVVYMRQFWYPSDMRMLEYCGERSSGKLTLFDVDERNESPSSSSPIDKE